jgi:hypothetical protein
MTITMLIGSFIGGATSEGGGAVAFPVMTLVLKLAPSVARDFSLMIQCCGENPFQPFLKVLITLLYGTTFVPMSIKCHPKVYKMTGIMNFT